MASPTSSSPTSSEVTSATNSPTSTSPGSSLPANNIQAIARDYSALHIDIMASVGAQANDSGAAPPPATFDGMTKKASHRRMSRANAPKKSKKRTSGFNLKSMFRRFGSTKDE